MPLKSEKHRVIVAIGGDRIEHDGIIAITPAALATGKPHMNSIIFTANAKHVTLDIKDYYCDTPMSEHEHVQMQLSPTPTEIIAQ